jgi:hypothetical protein
MCSKGPGMRQRAPGKSKSVSIQRGRIMLETIAILLIILWLLGLVTSYTLGGFIHILLVVAVIVIVIRVIQGRPPL